jgi:hypothetical protein
LSLYLYSGVLASSLNRDITYIYLGLSWFSLVPPSECWDSTSIMSGQLPSKSFPVQNHISFNAIVCNLAPVNNMGKNTRCYVKVIFTPIPNFVDICSQFFLTETMLKDRRLHRRDLTLYLYFIYCEQRTQKKNSCMKNSGSVAHEISLELRTRRLVTVFTRARH